MDEGTAVRISVVSASSECDAPAGLLPSYESSSNSKCCPTGSTLSDDGGGMQSGFAEFWEDSSPRSSKHMLLGHSFNVTK